ncbi:MAG: cytochrome c maturation protein CcmE [Acidimicrobiia bacterium]|nr:MAG: cytochrome c maturation protein CcmE [Acidimicrobiia bacterium]
MKKYARFVIPAVIIIGGLVVLTANLSSSLVYYNTPAEVQTREGSDSRLRLAGRVTPGSVVEQDTTVAFVVEDCDTAVSVIHTGVPPELFAEGIGVVVEGTWNGETFESDVILVKHDEQYRADDEDYDQDLNACSES